MTITPQSDERWEPSPDALVLEKVHGQNWYNRTWRRICERAGIGKRQPKDLRDTFASHLLTAGVPLKYISRQLGHAGTQVTERHYAKWIPEDDLYVEPLRVEPGEVPADLLARLPCAPRGDSTRRQQEGAATLPGV